MRIIISSYARHHTFEMPFAKPGTFASDAIYLTWQKKSTFRRGFVFVVLEIETVTSTEGGQAKKIVSPPPFFTFWTRVTITAPRRPKRTRHGSNAVWVLGNQPTAGFARRFGRLARQHVRCGAHMCPFQGQKSALGGRSNTRAQPRSTAYIRAQTML